jgi:hypothetical protein
LADFVTGDAAQGRGFLRLRNVARANQATLMRPIARVPLRPHRVLAANGTPLDPEPLYSVRFAARATAPVQAYVRVDLYHFDDSNPSEDPESILRGSLRMPLPALGASWQTLELPFTPVVDGQPTNMVFLYFLLSAPDRGDVTLDLDQIELDEWRDAGLVSDRPGLYSWVKNGSQSAQTLAVGVLDPAQ